MNNIAIPSERKNHVKSHLKDGLIFNEKAVEITILDRWGRLVWKKSRGGSLEPLHWEGIDFFGAPVTNGSYLCKIAYPDNFIVYVPFVFIQPHSK